MQSIPLEVPLERQPLGPIAQSQGICIVDGQGMAMVFADGPFWHKKESKR